MVEIKKGAQVNLKDGDIGGGAGGAGVTIGENATVNIGSGDIVGGDKTTDVNWQRRDGGGRSKFAADPNYDEIEQQFKKEVDVCGNVTIRRDGQEVGNGEIDLHQSLGDIGGRIILGPDLVVDMDNNGGLTICGIRIDDNILQQLKETPYEIARVTNVAETREKSEPEILAEVTVIQKLNNRQGDRPRGERTLKTTVFKLSEGEEAVTTPVKDLPLQSGDEKRLVWKQAVVFDGKPAQLKVLFVKKK